MLYTRAAGAPNARLGVVAAKRFAPRAVTRNTIKRLCRELFRVSTLPAVDCIVRLSAPVNRRGTPATSRSLKVELRTELVRLFASQNAPRRSPSRAAPAMAGRGSDSDPTKAAP